MNEVCKNWLTQELRGDADQYMKERLSLLEIAFRERDDDVRTANIPPRASTAPRPISLSQFSIPVTRSDARDVNAIYRDSVNRTYAAATDEINERFRQARVPLSYHNGFIQVSTDPLVEAQVAQPFWSLVATPKWANVDTDMKEAVDRRDSADRDPALYAAKALESTIKIISNEKGWTTGKERSAYNYIDNLVSAKNEQFLAPFEGEAMKTFFARVRNPLGHGPGDEPRPELTLQQTNVAIENCMSWIKGMIGRL